MKIVHEDDNIIVVHKEAGEPVQTASSRQQDLVDKLKKHLVKTRGVKGDPYVGVVHRLDQPVEGLLVFAKDKNSAAFLSKQLGNDFMNKIYRATVEGLFEDAGDFPISNIVEDDFCVGDFQAKEKVLVNYMYKDSADNRAVIVDDAAADNNTQKHGGEKESLKIQRAELSYQVVGEDRDRNISYLRIHLKTGRFHQIRAQLSAIGHPILGDVKYGANPVDNRDKKGIALCACELEFVHPCTKKRTKLSID